MDVLQYVGDLGMAAVLAVLVILAYERLVKQLGDVVRNISQ